ncbi:MAG TPA: helix-turn-helix domain-containing protein [Prolixibacteraceae bacterium]|jgi:hypothetical protein
MDEIFEIINALNRLKDKIIELSSKIDLLVKGPSPQLTGKYVNDEAASKIMRISPRTLAKMRAEGTIPFIKIRRRILYLVADLNDYLDCKCRQIKS